MISVIDYQTNMVAMNSFDSDTKTKPLKFPITELSKQAIRIFLTISPSHFRKTYKDLIITETGMKPEQWRKKKFSYYHSQIIIKRVLKVEDSTGLDFLGWIQTELNYNSTGETLINLIRQGKVNI